MKDSELIIVQMYSVQPIAQEHRSTFELPADPYSNTIEDVQQCREYLKGLGLIYFRDEDNSEGLVFNQLIDGKSKPIHNTPAFYSMAVLDRHELTIQRIPNIREDKLKKAGDDFWWMKWNEKVTIKSLTFKQVRLKR